MLRAVIDASKTRGDDDRGIDFRHHPLARAAIRVVTRVLAYLESVCSLLPFFFTGCCRCPE